MGLVQRQSLKYSLINFAGVAIGIAAVLRLYPLALAQYGLARWLLDAGMLLFPFISLGMPPILFRFFPRFQEKKSGHRGFLLLAFLWMTGGFLLFLIVFWLFSGAFLHFLTAGKRPEDVALLARFFPWVVPIAFFTACSLLLHYYAVNFKRTTGPTLLTDFGIKLTLPLLILAFLCGWIDERGLVFGLVGHFLVVIGGFVFYLKRIGEWRLRPDFSMINRPFVREIGQNMTYGILLGASQLALTRIDGLLVGAAIGLTSSAIYSIASVIANVLEVPYRAIGAISTPLLAGFWAKNDLKPMELLYQKSAINLLIVGSAMFGCIALSLDDLFGLLPNSAQLAAGKPVVLLLGLAKLFDMSTGLNNHLLIYSKKQFWHLGATVIFGLTNIGLLLFLIPKMGLTGAALAVLISVSVFNLLTVGFVKWQFGMQPFSKNTVIVLVLAASIFAAIHFLPTSNSLILNILWKSSLFLGAFGGAVLGLRLSPDLDEFFQKLKQGKLW